MALEKARSDAQDIRRRFNVANQQLTNANQILDSAQRSLASKSADLDRAKSDLTFSQNKKATALAQINHLESNISALKQKLNQMQKERGPLVNELARLRQRIPNQRGLVDDKPRQLQASRSRVDEIQRNMAPVEAQLAELDRDLVDSQNQRQILFGQIDQTKEELDRLNQSVRGNESNQVSHSNEILVSERQITSYIEENKRISAELVRYQRQLSIYQSQEPALLEDFNQKNQLALNAEFETEKRKNQADSVRRNFDLAMTETQTQGQNLGNDQGQSNGKNDGINDGVKVGQVEGAQHGQAVGLLNGFHRGQDSGLEKGHADGYSFGFNLPKNFEDGLAIGRAQGQKDAMADAERIAFPKGMAAESEKLMSVLPTNEVTIPNGTKFSGGNKIPLILSATKQKGFTASLLGEFLGGSTLQSFLSGGLEVCENLANKSPLHKGIDAKTNQCQQPYTVLRQACEASYELAYQASYQNSYSTNYKSSRITKCSVQYDLKFAENKDVRFEEGYKVGYSTGYADGDKKGSEAAKNRGYTQGHATEYNAQIGPLSEEQFHLGELKAREVFQAQSVIKLDGAELISLNPITPGFVTPGEDLSLKLNLINFGAQPALAGTVKVQVNSLSEALTTSASQNWIDVVTLPGSSIIHLDQITGVHVHEGAIPQTAALKVTMLFPDRTTTSTTVAVQIGAQITLSLINTSGLDLKPRVGWTNFLKFKFKNLSGVDAKSNIRFQMTAVNGDDRVTFEKSGDSVSASDIKANGELGSTVTMTYKIWTTKARGKNVTLRLQAFYEDQISFSQDFVVIPR